MVKKLYVYMPCVNVVFVTRINVMHVQVIKKKGNEKTYKKQKDRYKILKTVKNSELF